MSLCYAYRNYSCTLNSKFGREGFKNKFMFHFLVLLNSFFANLRKITENCEYTSDDKKFTIIHTTSERVTCVTISN